MKFHITGASILTNMNVYLPKLKDFAVTDCVDTIWDAYEITVDSLDDLVKLGKVIGFPLIIDTDYDPPQIGIYDNYIE